jgi:drug/metabolite transporter (DMT)-like permease
MKKLEPYYQVISCFFFALLGLQIKTISLSENIETIVFFRSIIGTIIIFFIIILSRKEISIELISTSNLKIHLLRTIFGTLAMYFSYKALGLISLSQATTIGFTKVFFTTLIASIFFKEKLKLLNLFLIFFGFLGIYLITNPDEIENHHGFYMSLFSAICVSGGIISIAYLSKKDEILKILFYHSLISSLIFFSVFHSNIIFEINKNFFYFFLLTLTALTGQYFNAKSYKNELTGKIVALSYSRIIFAYLLGFLFLGENIKFTTILGILIIILTTSLIQRKKEI